MRKSKEKKDIISGTSGWRAGDKFFDFIQDLKMDMRDYLKVGDIDGLVHTYQDYVIEIYPYIEQHFDKDVQFANIWTDDLKQYLSSFQRESTDHARSQNRKLIMEMNEILTHKKLLISKLIAKAELFLPINKPERYRPAVLESDDF